MLDNCSRLVKKALEMGADDAEAFVLERSGLEHTLEKNEFKLGASYDSVGRALRVIKDNRLGFTFSTDMESDEPMIKKALAVSKFGKELKDFSFPTAGKAPDIERVFDPKLAELPSEYGVEGCEEIVRGAKEVSKDINVAKAWVRYGSEKHSVANSQGLELEDSVTYLFMEVDSVLKDKGVSTGVDSYWSKLMDADFHAIGKESARWAVDTQDPKGIEGGKMTVLFHPMALRGMLEFILAPALYADKARKGESAFSDKMGQMVAQEDISIYDDPTMPNGPNSGAIDDEGTPSSRTDIISNGELRSFLYDSLTASEFSEDSTGNALRVARLGVDRQFKEPPTISARNFILEGPEKKWDDLIAEVDNGVLVNSVLGAHTSNPASGDFSVSSPRILRIENGELTHSVSAVMLSGNLPSLFANVSGMGDDRKTMKGAIGALGMIAPTVRFEGVQVTS
ncbi:MAG: TldD/PmbA family protein [Thermoplasmata archaeon]|nr:TldD/PmbA family protein [Thermoplasmata archaeon]